MTEITKGKVRRIRCCRRMPDAEWRARVAEMDARETRTRGRHGLKIIGRTAPTGDWIRLVDALIDHGALHPTDRAEAIGSEWLKDFGCPNCGSRSGFARRDPGRYSGVRVSCGHSCRTRDNLIILGLIKPWIAPAWASEPAEVTQARRAQLARLTGMEVTR